MSPPISEPLDGNQKYVKIKGLGSGAFGLVVLARNTVTGENVAIKFIERGDRVNKSWGILVCMTAHTLTSWGILVCMTAHTLTSWGILVCMTAHTLTSWGILVCMTAHTLTSWGILVRMTAHTLTSWGILVRMTAHTLTSWGILVCMTAHTLTSWGILVCMTAHTLTSWGILVRMTAHILHLWDAHCMSAPKSRVGTLAYMAPEVIKTTTDYDGKTADIWSCGVMLYVMLFGRYPFESLQQGKQAVEQRQQSTMDRILLMDWSFPTGIEISEECRDLLRQLMVGKDERIKMPALLQHPWVLQNLPPDALTMNEAAMGKENFTNVQTEYEIKQILKDAQTPGPNKYNFSSAANDSNAYDDLISNELNDDHSMSIAEPPRVPAVNTGMRL
eukprot:gene10210-8127_t